MSLNTRARAAQGAARNATIVRGPCPRARATSKDQRLVRIAQRYFGESFTEVVPDCQEYVGRDAHKVARRRMDFPTRARLHTVREIGKER